LPLLAPPQAPKYRSVTDIVRLVREIVRRIERKPPDILSDISETEVYCLSDPSVLVSDRTVALSNVNQNVPYSPGLEARMLNGKSEDY
jgi:actin-like ATPase involved in cell morphogenesis